LAIVGTVRVTDAGAGEDEETANPQWRRFVFLGRLIEVFAFDEGFAE